MKAIWLSAWMTRTLRQKGTAWRDTVETGDLWVIYTHRSQVYEMYKVCLTTRGSAAAWLVSVHLGSGLPAKPNQAAIRARQRGRLQPLVSQPVVIHEAPAISWAKALRYTLEADLRLLDVRL